MDSSVSGSARAASSYISSGKIIAFEYFWHILPIIFSEWLKLIVANAEQFGILSIVTALAVRFLFYEDWEENYRIRKTYMEELERVSEMSESDSVSVDTNTSERYCTHLLFSVRSTRRFVITEEDPTSPPRPYSRH